jgi:hypothetical protein
VAEAHPQELGRLSGPTAAGEASPQFHNSTKGRNNWRRNENEYCDFHGVKGHTDEKCMTHKRAEASKAKNKPQAKVAQVETV